MRISILAFFLHIGVLYAGEEMLVSGGESPNKQFCVVLIAPEGNPYPTAYFRYVPESKIIGEYFVGSYADYTHAKDPFNTEVLWSPDSRFAAIKSCTSKRTRTLEVFRVSRKDISQIKTSDYVKAILRELGSEEINRYIIEKPVRWLTPISLVIDVDGDCIIGPRDSGTWQKFHYEVCIDVSTGKTKWIKRLELKEEIGQTQPDGPANILPRWLFFQSPIWLGAQARWQLAQPSRLRCLGLHSRAVSGRM